MSKDMLKGIHRRHLGVGYNDQVMAPDGLETGGDGKPTIVFPAHNTVALFDDFFGDLIADEWAYVEGDTGYSNAIQTGTNGVTRVTGSETNGVEPESGAAITQGLVKQWKANMGSGSMKTDRRLRMAARLKFDSVSRAAEGGRTYVFAGFSDSGGYEFPVYDTGAGMISQAADAVGFVFGAGGDTGWSLVAAKSTAGDSGDQLAVAGSSYGPSTNTYTTLELEVRSGLSDTGGRAHFWVDGKKVGSIDSPVNSTVALTPWIGTWCQDTGYAQTLDIDYIAISGARDTGL